MGRRHQPPWPRAGARAKRLPAAGVRGALAAISCRRAWNSLLSKLGALANSVFCELERCASLYCHVYFRFGAALGWPRAVERHPAPRLIDATRSDRFRSTSPSLEFAVASTARGCRVAIDACPTPPHEFAQRLSQLAPMADSLRSPTSGEARPRRLGHLDSRRDRVCRRHSQPPHRPAVAGIASVKTASELTPWLGASPLIACT